MATVVNRSDYLLPDNSINSEAWLNHIGTNRSTSELHTIRNAVTLARLTGEDISTLSSTSCLQEGLAMAEILNQLHLDADTLAAAIVYPNVQYADLTLDDVREHLGTNTAKLIEGVQQMSVIRSLQKASREQEHDLAQIDNVRKMLVAMVEDVRVVLIKLAEQTCLMRAGKLLGEKKCQQIAHETMNIYAPLANRLGVSLIKSELEDQAFRYIQPKDYQTIATSMQLHKQQREYYLNKTIDILQQALDENGLSHSHIYGRAKHIYSIYRKMQRKNVSFEQIYDVMAIRVLVNTIEDCYTVLSIVHSLWEQIPSEFDDYIATPKPNGYQSIHTAVIGPEGKNLEVQIRTHEMHHDSEMGVAAHWRYKDGTLKRNREGKIAWLRQVLDWQKELMRGNDTNPYPLDKEIFEDRVYVFTPTGEIKALPLGATPLDFAYHIHSEVGHRCRGAKVNETIVPLNYQLKTGEQIEILTGKNPQPSRDWINPHLGYLKSSRARAKVHHWFKRQDYKKNLAGGGR